ncbi:hypothetical protein GYB61_09260 [bacterium]|nr:hypothetical protein [bacterium]
MNVQHLPLSLLLLRLGIAIVMVIWTIDKFVNPGHNVAILEGFYGIGGASDTISYVFGAAQVVLVGAFLLGAFKTISYGAVMLMHGASTLSSFGNYLAPFEGANLLFFAAWPMFAACIALFLMREHDTLLVVSKPR